MPTLVPVMSPVQSRFRDNFWPWKQANSRINFTQVTSFKYYGKNKASYPDKYTKRSFRWCKYCRLALYHSQSPQYQTKAGRTKPQLWSNYEPLKDFSYLTLTGEPWGVFSGLFGENRSRKMESDGTLCNDELWDDLWVQSLLSVLLLPCYVYYTTSN